MSVPVCGNMMRKVTCMCVVEPPLIKLSLSCLFFIEPATDKADHEEEGRCPMCEETKQNKLRGAGNSDGSSYGLVWEVGYFEGNRDYGVHCFSYRGMYSVDEEWLRTHPHKWRVDEDEENDEQEENGKEEN